MKLNSKCFLLSALLVLGLVAESSAAEKWTGIRCYDEYPDDEFAQTFTKVCYVGQFDSQDEAAEVGYGVDNMASVWDGADGFREKLNAGIYDAMQNCSWDGMCYGFELRFETDLDLGGFAVSGGDTACVNAFDPVLIPTDVLTNYETMINGNGKTVRGYCDIGQGDKSFFKGVENFGGNNESFVAVRNTRFSDLHFDSAYVKASGYGSRAAVFADTANGVSFNNVSVTNSTISSSFTAGGIVAGYEADYGDIYSVHVDATLRGSKVGGLFGSATFSSAELSSFISGVFVDVEVYAAGESSIIAGGIVGQLTARDASFTFHSDTVTLAMPNGADVVNAGGLVGKFFYNPSQSVELQNLNNVIDIFVNSTGDSTYAGGLVGYASLSNVSITDSLNKIHAVIATKGTPDPAVVEELDIPSEVYAGGEFGFIQEVAGLRIAHDAIDVRLTGAGSESQFFGGVAGAMMAAQGYTVSFAQNDVKVSVASSGEGKINVAMGGLLGMATVLNQQGGDVDFVCDTNTVTASMQAASTGGVYAGGLAGIVMDESGVGMGGFYSDESVIKAPEGSNLITVSSNTMEDLFMGGLVGRMNIPHFLIKTRRTRVDGDIVAAATSIADADAVGGLFGEINSYRVFVFDNLIKGDILANAENMGFVVGGVLSEVSDDEGVRITSNVHIGTKDVNAKRALGLMTLAENNTITNWDEGSGSIQDFNYSVVHNYRNAIASETTPLESTGVLDIDGSGYINAKVPYQSPNLGETVYRDVKLLNGVLDESTMKSRLLTYVLTQKENRAPNGVDDVESDYTCWDNDSTGVLYVCRNQDDRTVYKAQIDISSIYPKLREGERDSLADILNIAPVMEEEEPTGDTTYSLVGYTENNRYLNKNFVKRAKSLSVDYGTVSSSGYEYNLESYYAWSNQRLYAIENFDIEIVYEIAEPNVEPVNYVSLDEALSNPIYLWPKVTKVRRYGASGTVPPVFTMSGNTKQEYYLTAAFGVCPDVAPEGDPEEEPECEVVPVTPDPSGPATFSRIVESLGIDGGWPYERKIRLVYEASTEEQKTPEMTVGGDGNRSVLLTGYGYRDTSVVLFDSSYVGGSGLAILPIASKYTAKPSVGFTLDKWKVDFWVISNGESGFNIENCYDTTAVSETCASIASFTSAENYFGRTDDIYNAILEHADERENMRWSAELDSDGVLVMDSMISAFSGFTGSDFTFTYHMHVAPVMTAIPYTITFNVNVADPATVFIGGYTDTLVVYSMEDFDKRMFPQLYSAKACFAGWGEKATEPLYGAIELDENILGAVAAKDGSFSLYARWITGGESGSDKPTAEEEEDECANRPVMKVPLEYGGEGGSEQGSVYLWQKLVNADGDTLRFRHDFENDSLDIPNDSYNLRFHVGAEPKPGYALAEVLLLVDELETDVTDTTSVDVLHGEDLVVMDPMNASYRLYARFDKYVPVAFDLITGRDDVFYDDRFEKGDSLKVIRGSGEVELPAWIYTADSCVLGWSIGSGAEKLDYHDRALSDSLYEIVQETQKLYAVWGDAAQCADIGYAQVSAVAEHGSMELTEETDSGTRVHKFSADGHLIFPLDFVGTLRVHVEPEDGYTLERIVLFQNEDSTEVENGEFVDIFSNGAKLVAYFVKESKELVEVSNPVLEWSGNAVRFTFNDTNYAKVYEPWVYVMLENIDGDKVADTLFCKEDACDFVWEKFPLSSGYYLFTATARVLDGRDTTLLERDFEVESQISIAGANSWQMLSLASVDLDELPWDGDERFYWWAEGWNYGKYWQYQEFKKGQSPDPARGYWYSSLEGRPLQLKETSFVDDVKWELQNKNGGWNLVANPYGWYMDLGLGDEESVDDEIEFSRWNAEEGQYVPVKRLKPYEAVWAQLKRKESVTWEFSAVPDYVGQVTSDGEVAVNKSLNRRLAKVGGKNGWSLRLTLSDGKGKRDSWNVLGAGATAWQSEEPPAGMGDHVNLSILDGGKKLARSVKVSNDASVYEWQVALSASGDRAGYLEVSDMESLQERGLRVFVTVDGKTVEMHSGEKVPVALTTQAKTAYVRVAPSAKTVVAGNLQGMRAVQLGNMLAVSFDAPAGMAGAKARVDVFDTKGAVVASTNLRATEGKNAISLEMPRRGLYAVRVAVAGAAAVQRVLFK